MTPIALMVMGRPGSGKDTQADLLAEKFNLVHVVTSNLLQEKFREAPHDPIIQHEKARFDAGKICTPSWVRGVVKEKIHSLRETNFDGHNGLIFSGSPRTIEEAEDIVGYLEQMFGSGHVHAVYLEVTEEEAMQRIILRAARPLDKDRNALKVRMDAYEEQTKPVLEYLDRKGVLSRVDGMPHDVNQIHQNIVETLAAVGIS